MPSSPQFDFNASRKRAKIPARIERGVLRGIILSAALIAGASTFLAPRATAQDLGEIARQERAKKQNNPAPPATHVYTNDDLKRPEILTPEDKSHFTATNQPAPAAPQSTTPTASPAANSAPQSAAQPNAARSAAPPVTAAPTTISATVPLDQMPLGDVARFYHAKKREQAVANANPIPAMSPAPISPSPTVSYSPTFSSSKTSPAVAAARGAAIPGCVPCTSSATELSVATSVPAPIPAPIVSAELTPAQLAQMPLGDVARYYRAKKIQDALITITISASSAAAPAPSTNPYPLTMLAAPLAAMKSPPSRAAKLRVPESPSIAASRPPILSSRMSSSSPAKSRLSRIAPLVPKNVPNTVPKTGARYAFPQATSIRVARGDTLWQLARRYLGSGTRWTELLALNPTLQDPRRLQVGAQLNLYPTT